MGRSLAQRKQMQNATISREATAKANQADNHDNTLHLLKAEYQLQHTAPATINAKLMYSRNDTEAFIQSKLSKQSEYRFVMAEARAVEKLKVNKRSREAEIAYDNAQVASKRQKVIEKELEEQERRRKIDAVNPELEVKLLSKDGLTESGKRLTMKQMQLQLEWHRKYDPDTVLPKTLISKMVRKQLVLHLISVVIIYKKKKKLGTLLSGEWTSQPKRRTRVDLSQYADWEEQQEAFDEDLDENTSSDDA